MTIFILGAMWKELLVQIKRLSYAIPFYHHMSCVRFQMCKRNKPSFDKCVFKL